MNTQDRQLRQHGSRSRESKWQLSSPTASTERLGPRTVTGDSDLPFFETLLWELGHSEWSRFQEAPVTSSTYPAWQLNHPDLGADVRPISATAVCPVHDSPFRAGLGVRGPALEGRHSSGLWGGWRPLPVRRFYLQDFVLSWTLRYGSGLSQMFQWFHLLSLILQVSTRWHKIWCFGLNIWNSDILVFHEKSVFHILSDLGTWEG